jgi:hypothetical protein
LTSRRAGGTGSALRSCRARLADPATAIPRLAMRRALCDNGPGPEFADRFHQALKARPRHAPALRTRIDVISDFLRRPCRMYWPNTVA